MREYVVEAVERAVLWGEPREEVYGMMASNGIAGAEADEIYRAAQAARVSLVRAIGIRILLKGLIILAAAAALYLWFYYVQHRTYWGVFVVSGLGGFYGLWVAADGLARIVMAARTTGSVGEE